MVVGKPDSFKVIGNEIYYDSVKVATIDGQFEDMNRDFSEIMKDLVFHDEDELDDLKGTIDDRDVTIGELEEKVEDLEIKIDNMEHENFHIKQDLKEKSVKLSQLENELDEI